MPLFSKPFNVEADYEPRHTAILDHLKRLSDTTINDKGDKMIIEVIQEHRFDVPVLHDEVTVRLRDGSTKNRSGVVLPCTLLTIKFQFHGDERFFDYAIDGLPLNYDGEADPLGLEIELPMNLPDDEVEASKLVWDKVEQVREEVTQKLHGHQAAVVEFNNKLMQAAFALVRERQHKTQRYARILSIPPQKKDPHVP